MQPGTFMQCSNRFILKKQRGLSIVELMVGIALGLIIVAGAILMAINGISSNRAMLSETRLNQDLRAAIDLIARDLRRAGYWANAASGVYVAGGPSTLPQNNYRGMIPGSCNASPLPAASESISTTVSNICYYIEQGTPDNTVSTNEMFGFSLSNGVISVFIGSKTPQSLTDSQTLYVDSLQIIPHSVPISLASMCPTTPASAPTVTVRLFEIVIRGHAPSDAGVVRGMRTFTKVRNDAVSGSCDS